MAAKAARAPRILGRPAVERAPGTPVLTVATTAELIGRSAQTTTASCPTSIGRLNRAFEARELVAALTGFE